MRQKQSGPCRVDQIRQGPLLLMGAPPANSGEEWPRKMRGESLAIELAKSAFLREYGFRMQVSDNHFLRRIIECGGPTRFLNVFLSPLQSSGVPRDSWFAVRVCRWSFFRHRYSEPTADVNLGSLRHRDRHQQSGRYQLPHDVFRQLCARYAGDRDRDSCGELVLWRLERGRM